MTSNFSAYLMKKGNEYAYFRGQVQGLCMISEGMTLVELVSKLQAADRALGQKLNAMHAAYKQQLTDEVARITQHTNGGEANG